MQDQPLRLIFQKSTGGQRALFSPSDLCKSGLRRLQADGHPARSVIWLMQLRTLPPGSTCGVSAPRMAPTSAVLKPVALSRGAGEPEPAGGCVADRVDRDDHARFKVVRAAEQAYGASVPCRWPTIRPSHLWRQRSSWMRQGRKRRSRRTTRFSTIAPTIGGYRPGIPAKAERRARGRRFRRSRPMSRRRRLPHLRQARPRPAAVALLQTRRGAVRRMRPRRLGFLMPSGRFPERMSDSQAVPSSISAKDMNRRISGSPVRPSGEGERQQLRRVLMRHHLRRPG
jgi:hypothetical protein